MLSLLFVLACKPDPSGTDLGQQVESLQAQVDELEAAVSALGDADSTGGDYAAQADVDLLSEDVDDLLSELESLEGDVSDLTAQAGDTDETVSTLAPLAAALDAGELYVLASSTSQAIGDCEELLDWVDRAHRTVFAPDATLTLLLAPGSGEDVEWTCPSTIEIRAPELAHLHIVGDSASSSGLTLVFEGVDAVHVSAGGVLGLLQGVTLRGDGTSAGVRVEWGGRANLSPDDEGGGAVALQGFLEGVVARYGATVRAHGLQLTAVEGGIYAEDRSYVYAEASSLSVSSRGVYANKQSVVDMRLSTIESAATTGAVVLGEYGAYIHLHSAVVTGGGTQVEAQYGALISARGLDVSVGADAYSTVIN
ncbi:MAG: hypothetical protein H6742_15210 [Alphaproteobacteria bacterium]|nr:hypothetical protein [Alphaproteobacteria bacterium]